MRQTNAPPPAMSHSPAYYDRYRQPISSSPALPSTPGLKAPSPERLVCKPDNDPRGSDHVKASVSSATSGSTDVTDPRSLHQTHAYQYPSDPERGYGQDRSGRQCYRSPVSDTRISDSQQQTREMEQAPPATVIRYIRQEVDEDEAIEKPDHAIWILFWMSLLDPFYSLFSCLFSVVTLLCLIAITPIRLCRVDWSLSTCLIRTLCPIYRKHLQLLCAISVENAHNFEFSPALLVVIHIIAPIGSICMAFFSWIAAVFWLFAITMGNPDGTEKRDDGRATVLMARNKWEKFLLFALRRR